MIRMGEQYRDSIRDGRQVWINGGRVEDVTAHPIFRPVGRWRLQASNGSITCLLAKMVKPRVRI
jgi:hypothetical protein